MAVKKIIGKNRRKGKDTESGSENNNPLGLFVIGTNFGAVWMDAAVRSRNWEIVGCAARTDKSLKKASSKFGIPGDRLFKDIEKGLDEVKPDAVVVATPNDSHYTIARSVLERGIHLLLEKPITETWEEAVELIRLMRKKGTKAAVGQTLRGDLMLRLMEYRLKKGIIGKIEHILFISHYYWTGDPEKQWRFALENMFLEDIGIHQIDLIRMLSGNKKAESVTAVTTTPSSYPLKHIKTTASAFWKMEDGIDVTYFGSMGLKGEKIGWYGRVKVFGEKGSLCREPYGEPYVVIGNSGKRKGIDSEDLDKILPLADFEKIPYILEDFYYAIKNNRAPVTDLNDNINSHAILLATELSAAEKRTVYLKEDFPLP